MKKLLILTLLLITTGFANAEKKYSKGKVIYNDGKSKTGYIESEWRNTIGFKTNEIAEPEKINVDDLKTIVYFNDDGTTDELDRVRHYGIFNKLSDYEWWHVAERGIVSIYIIQTSMGSNATTKAHFAQYWALREGEQGASMIAHVSSGNPNSVFRKRAAEYFVDYPELADKIKSKVYTYKEIMLAVRDYNKWAVAKADKK